MSLSEKVEDNVSGIACEKHFSFEHVKEHVERAEKRLKDWIEVHGWFNGKPKTIDPFKLLKIKDEIWKEEFGSFK